MDYTKTDKNKSGTHFLRARSLRSRSLFQFQQQSNRDVFEICFSSTSSSPPPPNLYLNSKKIGLYPRQSRVPSCIALFNSKFHLNTRSLQQRTTVIVYQVRLHQFSPSYTQYNAMQCNTIHQSSCVVVVVVVSICNLLIFE